MRSMEILLQRRFADGVPQQAARADPLSDGCHLRFPRERCWLAPVFLHRAPCTFSNDRKPPAFRWCIISMWLWCSVFGMAVFGMPEGTNIRANDLHILFMPLMTFYGLALGSRHVDPARISNIRLVRQAFILSCCWWFRRCPFSTNSSSSSGRRVRCRWRGRLITRRPSRFLASGHGKMRSSRPICPGRWLGMPIAKVCGCRCRCTTGRTSMTTTNSRGTSWGLLSDAGHGQSRVHRRHQ